MPMPPPENQRNSGKKKAKKAGVNRHLWIGIMATIISICALLTSLYQAILERQAQKASLWPYVMITRSNVAPGGGVEPYFEIGIMNKGLGPALIREANYTFENKPFENPYILINKLFPRSDYFIISDLWSGRVISPGETFGHIILKGPQALIMDSLSQKLKIHLKFQSVLGETWLSRFNTGDEELVIKLEE